MFGILARLLEVLYSFWPSYGGSIILFTVIVMLALTPLTFKSTRSMLAMQALQPEMKKLQNRYKDDRQKLNEEMMKFYQENKISPLGGCLPMLLQLPIFFILYTLLERLTRRGPFGQDLGTSVACNLSDGARCVNGVFTQGGFFHPEYLKHTSQLYQDLTHTRTMDFMGIDLSQSALKVLPHGVLQALPYLFMVLVVVGLTYIQQVQLQSRTPKGADVNPTQQMTMKIMPVVMGVIYIIIPASVVLYFLVSSVFRIGQQAMVTRTFYSGPNAIAIPTTAVETTDEKPKRFVDRFKPSEESLPRVGARAKAAGGAKGSGDPESSGTKKPSGPKGTGGKASGGSKAGKRPPSKSRSSKTGSSTPAKKGSEAARGKQPSSSTKANEVQSTARASEAPPTDGSPNAPSRKAPATKPSRKAPTRPNAGPKKSS